ncbi:hypothetical protein GCM10009663_52220 [Kitasatospora arboriphila]|uniref:Transposase IS200-like domain-containing protein n=1 Tax=Kitasatospora arboriphila TaxID=258052 RepID=A0ABN1TW08_9ACTN
MRAVCEDFEAEPIEFNGQANHVHLLADFPPKVAVSRLVNSLKGVSSRTLRQEFTDLVRHYWRAQCLWSGSHSPDQSAVRRSASRSSASSNRTGRTDPGRGTQCGSAPRRRAAGPRCRRRRSGCRADVTPGTTTSSQHSLTDCESKYRP